MAGLLFEIGIIQCEVSSRFGVLPTGVENIVTVEKKEATELEFSFKDFFNGGGSVPHYFWVLHASVSRSDRVEGDGSKKLPVVEFVLSDGEDVMAFKLPFHWYKGNKRVVNTLRNREVHFCHAGHQTDDGILRVILNTRSQIRGCGRGQVICHHIVSRRESAMEGI